MNFYQHTLEDLRALLASQGLPVSGANLLFNWHYKKRKTEPCTDDLAKVTQDFIKRNLSFALPEIDSVQLSEDDRTVKFLFRLTDGKKVETVLIPSNRKYGICLSSQVGCAMKCSFCHTGLQGLERHLETHEIVGQFLAAQAWLNSHRPTDNQIATIVFMGQGEPLHNFDSVRRAVDIFISQHGLCLGHDKITISTAGFLPGLIRWKDEMPDVNIALSLHATDSSKRSELIPINQKYPLEDVLAAVKSVPKNTKRYIIFEYLLARGFNDSLEDVQGLAIALKDIHAFVNIIPFNPFPGAKYERPSESEVKAFKEQLDALGVPNLVRFTKGQDILAACGQLNSKS